MASPNSAFVEAAVMTLGASSDEIADNVSRSNILLDMIRRKGHKRVGTGPYIAQDIEYAENSTLGWYQGYQTLDISPSVVFTKATFPWKQASGAVTISGFEEATNSGREAVHNLLTSRMKNLKTSATNFLGRAIYSNGTDAGGQSVGGLQLLVPDINTNTVGGISGATYPWWQNKVYSFSGQATPITNPTGAQLVTAMNLLSLSLIRGTDHPDAIVTDANYYNLYLSTLQANQRFTNDGDKAGAGFENVLYKMQPVVYDDVCPASHMYMLNFDYLYMEVMKGRDWKPLGERAPVNQDALVLPLVWMGNLTCSNRALQGVITP